MKTPPAFASRRLAIISLSLGLTAASHAGTIILATGNPSADAPLIAYLQSLGHTVVSGAYANLDTNPAGIAALNAADLVIVSRNTDSGGYASNATEIAAWDGLTSPVLLGNAFLTRTNRWSWVNTGGTFNDYAFDLSAPPGTTEVHPFFEGLTPTAGGEPAISGLEKYSFSSSSDLPGLGNVLGNGLTIGVRNNVDSQNVILASWAEGETTGSGNVLGGERVFYAMAEDFANFTDNGRLILENILSDLIVEEDLDGDGLPDSFEYLIINFDEFDDIDGLDDVAGPNDLPAFTDFDGDGLSDADEFANKTSPTNSDSDGDGLLDGPEVAGTDNDGISHGFGPTDPNLADSDGDGFSDFIEVRYGFDPKNNAIIPGDEVAVVNGGFEEPIVFATEGVAVSSGTVPGWSAVENDLYVIDFFDFADGVNPSGASEGFQFASADRRSPAVDVEASELDGGIDASMSIRQDIDVSSLATEIDDGARTLVLGFDFFDNDTADQGVVTMQFLDGSGTDLGRPSVFRTANSGNTWVSVQQQGYPPVGTRTVRVTVAADKVAVNTTTIRNIFFDNFSARLVDFDKDEDGLPDGWELTYGLDPDDDADADISSDLPETLTNLEEFQLGTDPTLADTDGDGINDDVEVANGTDPLDPNSPAPDLRVVNMILTKDGTGAITEVEVIVSGLNPNNIYSLVRGTDLESFPDVVDTFQPNGTTESFYDFNPLPGTTSTRAFYRLED